MADLLHTVIQGCGFLPSHCLIHQDNALVLLGENILFIFKIKSERRKKKKECVLVILDLNLEWHTTLLFKMAGLSHKAVYNCNEVGKY